MSIYKYDQQFEHIHALETPFEVGEYEECVFSHVDFGGVNLTDFNFSGCVFEHCNLSGVRLDGAILRDCKFEHCKLLGLRFETCNTLIFSVSFADCLLHHSSFYQLKLKKMPLLRCSLKEVDQQHQKGQVLLGWITWPVNILQHRDFVGHEITVGF